MFSLIRTFLSALVWYAVLTLPSLFLAPMYFMSLLFALQVCWIAGLFFIIMAYLVKQVSVKVEYKIATLYVVALVAVWIAFLFIEVFNLWKNIWQDVSLLLFPLAALLAAWFSIYGTRDYLLGFFNDDHSVESVNLTNAQYSSTENV